MSRDNCSIKTQFSAMRREGAVMFTLYNLMSAVSGPFSRNDADRCPEADARPEVSGAPLIRHSGTLRFGHLECLKTLRKGSRGYRCRRDKLSRRRPGTAPTPAPPSPPPRGARVGERSETVCRVCYFAVLAFRISRVRAIQVTRCTSRRSQNLKRWQMLSLIYISRQLRATIQMQSS